MDQSEKFANADPESYPTVVIAGKEIEVKYRTYDLMDLQKRGISLEKLESNALADVAMRTFELLRSGIAHAFESTPDLLPTVEQLSKTDWADWGRINAAIAGSLAKAQAQIAAFTQPKKTATDNQVEATIQ